MGWNELLGQAGNFLFTAGLLENIFGMKVS